MYVSHYKTFPFSLIRQVSQKIRSNRQTHTPWFLTHFIDPVEQGDQIFEAVKSAKDVSNFNERYLTPVKEFEDAYEKILLTGNHEIQINEINVLQISFSYLNKTYDAYSIAQDGFQCGSNTTSILIFPGSGHNQSTKIAMNEPENYHYGVQEIVHGIFSHRYVMVRPNNDFLALHNGMGKKASNAVTNSYHLNHNGSFSASYLLGALATAKYLRSCHESIGLIGLSFGGLSALIVGVLAPVDFVVVASGYSILQEKVNIANFDQIMGLAILSELNSSVGLRKWLEFRENTKFLFSWGSQEPGAYGIEANSGLTQSVLLDLKNVRFNTHSGGHEFSVPATREFLTNISPTANNQERSE